MKLARRRILHLTAGAAALAMPRLAARPSLSDTSLSDAPGADRHRFPGRERDRYYRAADCRPAVGAARPASRRRRPAGRRQQYRHRSGGARAARRLHAAGGDRHQRGQRDALQGPDFRFRPRRCAGHRHLPVASCHGGQSRGAGADAGRVHRLCQGQSGQGRLRVTRLRHRAQHDRRAVQDHGRRRPGPCAVSRQLLARSARRPRPGPVRADRDADRSHQRRQAARAGGDRRHAIRCAAQRPHGGGIRAGL